MLRCSTYFGKYEFSDEASAVDVVGVDVLGDGEGEVVLHSRQFVDLVVLDAVEARRDPLAGLTFRPQVPDTDSVVHGRSQQEALVKIEVLKTVNKVVYV